MSKSLTLVCRYFPSYFGPMIAPANFVTELRNPFLQWNSDALTAAVLCVHALELVHELLNLPLRKNLGAVLEVEVDHFLCREHWAVVLVRSSDHGREQSSCARSRNHIKVVRDPGFRSIQFLNPHNINTFHCMDRVTATGSWGMHAGRRRRCQTCSLDSRKEMMVPGMRPRTPPPSMLSTVISFPLDGGGVCGCLR